MNTIMGHKLTFILVIASLTHLTQAVRQSRHLYRNFQHEIIYPTKNFFETSVNFEGQPTSYSAGFSLKSPRLISSPFPSFNFFPSRSLPREFSPSNLFRGHPDPFGLPRFFPKNLFTPNTIDQRPETKGQIEEYKKDLDEQAKEAEMELNTNSVTSEFVDLDALDGITTQSNNYVSVKSKDYKYSYST